MAKILVPIEVSSFTERDALKRAMKDRTTRATVLVIGHLLSLPDGPARLKAIVEVSKKLGIKL
jgi:hypothetical protein